MQRGRPSPTCGERKSDVVSLVSVSDFTYSEGLDILGYFIEVVSGQPFDKFLRERLFDPLGMDDTWFYLPDSKHSRLVTVQAPGKGGNSWQRYPVTCHRYYVREHQNPDLKLRGEMAEEGRSQVVLQ